MFLTITSISLIAIGLSRLFIYFWMSLGSLSFSSHLPFSYKVLYWHQVVKQYSHIVLLTSIESIVMWSRNYLILVIYVFFFSFSFWSLWVKSFQLYQSSQRLSSISAIQRMLQFRWGPPPRPTAWNRCLDSTLGQSQNSFRSPSLRDHCVRSPDAQYIGNNYLIYFVQFLSCFRQEGKYRPCYSILPQSVSLSFW